MRPCSAAERPGPEVAVASMGIRQHTDATRDRPIDEGIAMSGTGFAYPNLFGKKVPPPAPRWAGNARYNFIGGHNDRSLIPIEGLIAATASVLRREGQSADVSSGRSRAGWSAPSASRQQTAEPPHRRQQAPPSAAQRLG